MPAIQEFAQVVVEHYDYDQSAWVEDAELGDDMIISAGIRKQCCPDGAIAIGGVYAALLNITCRMPGMTYFQVRSARLKMKHKYAGEQNFEQLGVFYVTDCKRLAGDLFQISAQDAVGWTDTSANNATSENNGTKFGIGAYMKKEQDDYGIVQLHTSMSRLTAITNSFIFARSGISNLLAWDDYSVSNNHGYYYANQITNAYTEETPNNAYFPLYVKDGDLNNLEGSARSDLPRDYFRLLAELACGFVYAKENGHLTLGQFGQPEFGYDNGTTDTTQVINKNETEYDSSEIADYDINILRAEATAECHKGWSSYSVFNNNPGYKDHAYIRYAIVNNPFLNGWYAAWDDGPRPVAEGIWFPLSKYGGGYTIRPFHATVHKPVRFHLGQRIKFVGFDTNDLLSIVTSIQWNFRGGWKIACGGEDGRSMLDCIRATKGDRVARDLRNSITALRDQS